MSFAIVGTACIALTIASGNILDASGKHVAPVCGDAQGPKTYPTYQACFTALNNPTANPGDIPALPNPQIVIDGNPHPFQWYTLHCIQLPPAQ